MAAANRSPTEAVRHPPGQGMKLSRKHRGAMLRGLRHGSLLPRVTQQRAGVNKVSANVLAVKGTWRSGESANSLVHHIEPSMNLKTRRRSWRLTSAAL